MVGSVYWLHCRYLLNVWDVGGQQTIRSYWRNYYEQVRGREETSYRLSHDLVLPLLSLGIRGVTICSCMCMV